MAKKRDYFKEAEWLLSQYNKASSRHHRLQRSWMIKAMEDQKAGQPIRMKPVKAFENSKKEIARLDPSGLLQMISGTPFIHTLILLWADEKYVAKTRYLLEKSRYEDNLRVIVVALRNGWIKPLK